MTERLGQVIKNKEMINPGARRQAICELITKKPGYTINQISQALEVNHNNASKIIEEMRESDSIKIITGKDLKIISGNMTVFVFPKNFTDDREILLKTIRERREELRQKKARKKI